MTEEAPEKLARERWPSALGRRAVRASLLDAHLYEEVEADRRTMGQATVVVLLSAAASGIGSFENGGFEGIVFSAVAALVGWFLWAWVACWIGTRWLPQPQTSADTGELLRTLGFASAPGVLRVFGLWSVLNPWLYLVTGCWMLAAMVVALRQALDYEDTRRAIAVAIIGAPLEVGLLLASMLFMGPWPI